jgi:hypothetical protein
MNINFFLKIILILFAILASNGIIYNLKKFHFNIKNYWENISLRTNSSSKDGLTLTSLIASNPINLTSSESSASQTLSMTSSESSTSQTLSVTSSESSTSQTLSVTSSETDVSQDIFDNWIDSDIGLGESITTHTENAYLSIINNGNIPSNIFDNTTLFTSIDSRTILNHQQFEEWREIAMAFHDYFSIGTPIGILQTFKFEELKILYSQDLIHFGITHTELRLIIEHFSSVSLFKPDINELILTVMSYYHL